MKVDRIESSLHPRYWSFNRQAGALACQLVMLSDGSGEAEVEALRFSLEAPALLWLGDLKSGRLHAAAGTTGFRANVSAGMVAAAMGEEPESLELRYLTERNFVLSLAGQQSQANLMERCFDDMLRELGQPPEGSRLMLSALLRMVLTSAWRISAGSGVGFQGAGGRSSLLLRFRQLVEMNFRHRWPVARYAAALGISPDRLHAICTDGLGKSPKALISERLVHEAKLRLERPSPTIEQFAHSLGFGDAAHFSNFFKRMTGTTPGRYRAQIAQSREKGETAPPPSFADWP